MIAKQSIRFNGMRTAIALVGCAFGFGIMVFGFGTSSSSKNRATSAVTQQSSRKLPAWNVALGDVVVMARDLGFSVKAANDAAVDETKIAAKIESQLQSLRTLYRQESSRNEDLMGGIVLQLKINAAGEVAKTLEVTSRIGDSDFRKAVVAEASAWTFDQLLPPESTIICPLLFVREGMDITTLIHWERFLSHPGKTTVLGKNNHSAEPIQQIKRARNPRSREAASNKVAAAVYQAAPAAAVQPARGGAVYQMKYSTAIREEPKFSATAVARFATGTKVTLLGKRGDWYEVHYEGGPRGFLRKEFVAPVNSANATLTSRNESR
ncbi:MAG: AgmX/PglI C-terminal domain-containing protein [Deltaproteobacteria bacterium]|nr:AgmX/PglI C-terminal domain-containing protein [Deltaproteobacteria bacterium]